MWVILIFVILVLVVVTVLRKHTYKPWSIDIDAATKDNQAWRDIPATFGHSQVALMNVPPGEELGEEVHNGDQFFRIEAGEGVLLVNDEKIALRDGIAAVVPAGARHNVINTGEVALQFYTIYSPPEHRAGTLHMTKADE